MVNTQTPVPERLEFYRRISASNLTPLWEVLHNLIQNAILYIPKYCVVTVRAMCVNEKLILMVEDNGNGFPEDEIDKVTSPKGCTIAGLNQMEHAGFSSAFIKGIVTSAQKAGGLYTKNEN